MHKLDEQEHLVIVGAGLVGATLAALLAQTKDLRITLIDRSDAPILSTAKPYDYDPRVVALTLASQTILQKLAVWQTIQTLGSCDYQQMVVWDDEGTGSIDFHATDIAQNQLGSIVENRIVLHSILQCLEGHKNITLLRGQGVNDLQQNDQQATLVLDDGQRIDASLIVAADGGLSKVRELAGFNIHQSDYAQSAIIGTIKTEKPHQNTAWQNFLSTGPLAVLPLHGTDQRHSSIVWSADTPAANDLMSLTSTAFDEKLSRSLEERFGKIHMASERYCIPLIARHAKDYFNTRVVLTGDAAHTIHPLAGQGVNLGLQDAASLAQEIIRAKSRQLSINDASVLRRYQRQRKHQNTEMLLLMKSFKTLFGQRSPYVRLARNYGLTMFNSIAPIKNWLAKQASGI